MHDNIPGSHSKVWKRSWFWSKVDYHAVESLKCSCLVKCRQLSNIIDKSFLCYDGFNVFTSLCLEKKYISYGMNHQKNYVLGLIHFRPFSRLCKHFGNRLPCPLWTFWIWLTSDNHFALIRSSFPSSVDMAHQYRWLTMLLLHSPTTSQSFFFASASIFFRKPAQ